MPHAEPAALLLSIYNECISSYQRWGGLVDAENRARLVALGNEITAAFVVVDE